MNKKQLIRKCNEVSRCSKIDFTAPWVQVAVEQGDISFMELRAMEEIKKARYRQMGLEASGGAREYHKHIQAAIQLLTLAAAHIDLG